MTAVALLLPYGSNAASYKVNATLPDFNVHINGERVNNSLRQYPFILYKGITYFPMTYDDCEALGLEAKWSQEKGLVIHQTGAFAQYNEAHAVSQNHKSLQASIAEGPITVNGEVIDNTKEEYPLLVYRDITYFPITWRFASEEFKWNYSFNAKEGLSIATGNVNVKRLELPYEVKGAIVPSIIDGHYYYVAEIGGEGYVYRSPVSNPSKASQVQRLESSSGYNPYVSFFKLGDEIIFTNYIGGATMGSNLYYRINSEGLGEKIIAGKYSIQLYKGSIIAVNHFAPPLANNLYYVDPTTASYGNIGDSHLMYGWVINDNGSYMYSNNMSIYNDEIYVIAMDTTADTMESMLYRVDINTNSTTQVSQLSLNDFIIEGDTLLFIERNTGNLYSKGLVTGEEKLLVEERVQQYAVYEDQVYFTTSEGLFRYSSKGLRESIAEDLKIESFKIQQGYFILQLHNDEAYGLIILDSEGGDIYKTTDKIVSMSVENNLVVYTTYINRNNYVLELTQ